MMRINNPERALSILLKVSGLLLLTALLPVVMPFHWMEVIHAKADLGKLPDAVIVHYLTRSCSLLYAMHGALVLFTSFDVRRYLPFILFQGALSVLFGVAMLILDIAVGMPVGWIIGEGPFIVCMGLVIIWICRQANKNQ